MVTFRGKLRLTDLRLAKHELGLALDHLRQWRNNLRGMSWNNQTRFDLRECETTARECQSLLDEIRVHYEAFGTRANS